MEKIIFEIIKSIFKNSTVNFIKECPNPDTVWSEDNSSGCLYNHSEDITGFVYTTTSGLKQIEPTKCGYSSNANGTRNREYGIEMKNVPEGAFLIIRSVGSYSDCNGRDDKWDNVSIYSLKDLVAERKKAAKLADEELMKQIKEFLS